MTTNTKVIAILASISICLVLLFPPRMIGTEKSLKSVSRGFLFGDVYLANIPSGYQPNEKGHHVMVYTSFPCRIDVTRVVMELMVVLSAATMLVFFLNLRSSVPPKNGAGSE